MSNQHASSGGDGGESAATCSIPVLDGTRLPCCRPSSRIARALQEAADSRDAFGILHGSPHPLVVVLDRRHLTLLELARADRRLATHHAYVLLGTWTHADLLLMLRLRRQLRLWIVRGRRQWRAIVRAVARAAGTLPRDPLYPLPTADHPPVSARTRRADVVGAIDTATAYWQAHKHPCVWVSGVAIGPFAPRALWRSLLKCFAFSRMHHSAGGLERTSGTLSGTSCC